MGIVEAVVVSLAIFTVFFCVPSIFRSCRPCSSDDLATGCTGEPSNHRRLASAVDGNSTIHAGFHGLKNRQWTCPFGQYNELATLFHAGQEELVKHLLVRNDVQGLLSFSTLLTFLLCYLPMAIVSLGLAVPAGNFIPALTIGAAVGRLEALLLVEGGLVDSKDVGKYAMVGAAATLGGVTRMTMTIAVILAEVSDDVQILPVCMLGLVVARAIGDLLSASFDHGMIEISRVAFLQESPPLMFEILTAKDVMASQPIVLLEVSTVRDIIRVLVNSSHNGFPVVRGSCLSATQDASKRNCLTGIILRRQLLVMLKEKVWDTQMYGKPLSPGMKEHFLTSFFRMAQADLAEETQSVVHAMPGKDLDAVVDLRSFCDPAPFVVHSLSPLKRVYKLFNEIGVRHLPVLDADHSLTGIITRKDVKPETISDRLSATEVRVWANEMHRYWRGLLFGGHSSFLTGSGSCAATLQRRDSVALSSHGAAGSSVSNAPGKRRSSLLGSMCSLVVGRREATDEQKAIAVLRLQPPPISRRCSAPAVQQMPVYPPSPSNLSSGSPKEVLSLRSSSASHHRGGSRKSKSTAPIAPQVAVGATPQVNGRKERPHLLRYASLASSRRTFCCMRMRSQARR